MFAPPAWAEPPPGDDPSTTATDDAAVAAPTPSSRPDEDSLPDIEARDYAVKVVRRSNSNRIYLFDDITDAKPKVGRILLLKRESEPIMAFRVMKTYGDLRQFAAKRVRRYGSHRFLDRGESFRAIEKIQDLAAPVPTAEDVSDIRELEDEEGTQPRPDSISPDAEGSSPGEPGPSGPPPEVNSYDPELDAGSSPPPSGAVDSEDSHENPADEEDEENLGLAIDEVTPLDMHTHWLTGQGGLVRTRGPDGGPYFASAGGARYGLTLGKMMFLRKAQVQDSFVVEGGLMIYKIVNYEVEGNAYSILAASGTARYNILLGETFGIFFYGGLLQNRVIASAGASEEHVALLSSVVPAAGAGVLFRVGPSWDARLDAGLDMFAVGLVLRF